AADERGLQRLRGLTDSGTGRNGDGAREGASSWRRVCGNSESRADAAARADAWGVNAWGLVTMSPETLEQIRGLVRCGFYPRQVIEEIVCEELNNPGELDERDVSRAVDSELKTLAAEQVSWLAVTDCDRLDQVFDALNKRGVVALQNAGYMQDDG